MAQTGSDCYFFYYSSCTKGANCSFRHCEAALGNEVTCSHWQNGSCTRPQCRFRHMEISVNRNSTPCYWENQPSGCTKPHCVFRHFKPKLNAPSAAEPTPPVTATSTNKVFRPGVLESNTSTQLTSPQPEMYESASPKIEPIVVNPCEDDSDADSVTNSPMKMAGKPVVRAESRKPVLQTARDAVKDNLIISRPVLANPKSNAAKPGGATAVRRRKIHLLDGEDNETGRPHMSFSENDLYDDATRRNVVIDDSVHKDPTEGFHAALKKSKSSLGLTVQRSPEKSTVKLSVKKRLGGKTDPAESESTKVGVKKRLGRIEPCESESAVKLSVKDRLGGSQATDTSPSRGNVKSRLGLSGLDTEELEDAQREEDSKEEEEEADPGSIKVKSLAEIRKEKVNKALFQTAKSESEEEADPGRIKVKSLAEIRDEKARKAQLQKPETEAGAAKKTGRVRFQPVTGVVKPAPKRKIITYSDDFFDGNTKPETAQSETAQQEAEEMVKVRSLAEIRVEKARKKQAAVKKEREIYMPPAMKNKPAVKPPAPSEPPSPPKGNVVSKKPAESRPDSKVSVKTFSEIMAEKRRKQQELKAKMAAEKSTTESNCSTRPKVRLTPIVFDLPEKEESKTKTVNPTRTKPTVVVSPVTNSDIQAKENVNRSPVEQKSPTELRLCEASVLGDSNASDNVKSLERMNSRESAKRLSLEAETFPSDQSGESVSPGKRRSSSQGSDLPSKKKSRQSLNLEEDDFFFGDELDDVDDDVKIDEGDLLQDIDELLA